MPNYCDQYIYLNTHEFKNNIARWTRLLEGKVYKAALIKRHEKVVGVYMTDGADELDRVVKAIRARKESPIPLMPSDIKVL